MGLMDLFSNMSEWDPKDLEAGGIIGASMAAKARKKAKEMAARPKPGKYCLKTCAVNDGRCNACMDIQRRLENNIYKLEQLESTENLSAIQVKASKPKIENCGFCGAPYESGNKVCSYCGTEYPAETYESGVDEDVPVSKIDRKAQIDEKIEETWGILCEKLLLVAEYQKETAENDMLGKIQKLAASVTGALQGQLKQNAAEIRQAAAVYGVSVAQYIHGVATDEMKTPKTLYYEEQSRALNQQSQQRNAAFAAQQAQRQQQSKYTAMDYMQRHAQTTNYGYVGGASDTGSCCGKCRFYLPRSKECLNNKYKHPSGPSDYCRSFQKI